MPRKGKPQPTHQERSYKNLCVSVPKEAIGVLDKMAVERDVSRSEVVRAALEEYLGKPFNRPRPRHSSGWRRASDGEK